MNTYTVVGGGKTDSSGNLHFGSENVTGFQFLSGTLSIFPFFLLFHFVFHFFPVGIFSTSWWKAEKRSSGNLDLGTKM
jgi:hypothetical protein